MEFLFSFEIKKMGLIFFRVFCLVLSWADIEPDLMKRFIVFLATRFNLTPIYNFFRK